MLSTDSTRNDGNAYYTGRVYIDYELVESPGTIETRDFYVRFAEVDVLVGGSHVTFEAAPGDRVRVWLQAPQASQGVAYVDPLDFALAYGQGYPPLGGQDWDISQPRQLLCPKLGSGSKPTDGSQYQYNGPNYQVVAEGPWVTIPALPGASPSPSVEASASPSPSPSPSLSPSPSVEASSSPSPSLNPSPSTVPFLVVAIDNITVAPTAFDPRLGEVTNISATGRVLGDFHNPMGSYEIRVTQTAPGNVFGRVTSADANPIPFPSPPTLAGAFSVNPDRTWTLGNVQWDGRYLGSPVDSGEYKVELLVRVREGVGEMAPSAMDTANATVGVGELLPIPTKMVASGTIALKDENAEAVAPVYLDDTTSVSNPLAMASSLEGTFGGPIPPRFDVSLKLSKAPTVATAFDCEGRVQGDVVLRFEANYPAGVSEVTVSNVPILALPTKQVRVSDSLTLFARRRGTTAWTERREISKKIFWTMNPPLKPWIATGLPVSVLERACRYAQGAQQEDDVRRRLQFGLFGWLCWKKGGSYDPNRLHQINQKPENFDLKGFLADLAGGQCTDTSAFYMLHCAALGVDMQMVLLYHPLWSSDREPLKSKPARGWGPAWSPADNGLFPIFNPGSVVGQAFNSMTFNFHAACTTGAIVGPNSPVWDLSLGWEPVFGFLANYRGQGAMDLYRTTLFQEKAAAVVNTLSVEKVNF